MRTRYLLGALLVCALPAWAQPDPALRAEPMVAREYSLDAPLVSSAEAQKLALPLDIQIHLREASLLEALRELEKQSGLRFDLSNVSQATLDKKISVDTDTPAVARALGDIADEAAVRLSLSHSHTFDSWHVQEDKGKETPRLAPVFADGLFETRLLKVDVTLFKQLDLETDKPVRTQNDALNLTLELSPDPGWPLGGLPVVSVTRAADDKGRSLIPPQSPTKKPGYDAGFMDAWSKKAVTLQLLPPADDARRIAHLEGESLNMIATKRARWEVPDLLGNKQNTFNFNIGDAEVTTTLSGARLEGDNVRFSLEFALPPGVSWQKFSGNNYSVYAVLNWITLEDANGTRLIPNGGGGSSSSNTFSSNGNFTLPAALQGQDKTRKLALPIKMIFEPPIAWVQARVKFQFDDVPLP